MPRPVLAGLALALLATAAPADNAAGTPEDPIPLNHYRCQDLGLVKVGFADGRAVVIVDDAAPLSVPYLAELPEDHHVYATDSFVMVLGDDDIWVGPRTQQGRAIVRPNRQCAWEA